MLLGDSEGVIRTTKSRPALRNHQEMESFLGRYSGLILYLKEMDEGIYSKLCAVCHAFASSFYSYIHTIYLGLFHSGERASRSSSQGATLYLRWVGQEVCG